MRRPATLCAVLTFGLLAQFAPLAPARAVDGALDPTFGTLGKTRVFFDQGTTDEDRGHDVAVDALDRIVGFAASGAARDSFFQVRRNRALGSDSVG